MRSYHPLSRCSLNRPWLIHQSGWKTHDLRALTYPVNSEVVCTPVSSVLIFALSMMYAHTHTHTYIYIHMRRVYLYKYLLLYAIKYIMPKLESISGVQESVANDMQVHHVDIVLELSCLLSGNRQVCKANDSAVQSEQ